MNYAAQIAQHLRQVFSGGNWTWVNLKDTLHDLSCREAEQKLEGFNTIAALVFHIHYYIQAITRVLEGKPIDAHDKFSFNVSPLLSEEAWHTMKENVLYDAEKLAGLVEKLEVEKLPEIFIEEKYGNYLRNLMGVIEHTHYHLGQIVILKKIIRSPSNL